MRAINLIIEDAPDVPGNVLKEGHGIEGLVHAIKCPEALQLTLNMLALDRKSGTIPHLFLLSFPPHLLQKNPPGRSLPSPTSSPPRSSLPLMSRPTSRVSLGSSTSRLLAMFALPSLASVTSLAHLFRNG